MSALNKGFAPLEASLPVAFTGDEYQNHLAKTRFNNSRGLLTGFTLVELTVSVALLGLLVLGSVQIFPRALQLIGRAAALTGAVNFAQVQIETLITEPYDTVEIGNLEVRHPIGQQFERETVVRYIDPQTFLPISSDRGLKRIDVRVFYPTAFGERQYEISSVITRS